MSAEQERGCTNCARYSACTPECPGPRLPGTYWRPRADAPGVRQEPAGGANEDRKHSHYFKDVSTLQTVDVYRVLSLFGVTDPCLQHAVKKLLVAGGRGAGKDIARDVKEAMDTLARWVEMRAEDEGRAA